MKHLKKYNENIDFDDIDDEEILPLPKVGDKVLINRDLYEKYPDWTRNLRQYHTTPLTISFIEQNYEHHTGENISTADFDEIPQYAPLEMCIPFNGINESNNTENDDYYYFMDKYNTFYGYHPETNIRNHWVKNVNGYMDLLDFPIMFKTEFKMLYLLLNHRGKWMKSVKFPTEIRHLSQSKSDLTKNEDIEKVVTETIRKQLKDKYTLYAIQMNKWLTSTDELTMGRYFNQIFVFFEESFKNDKPETFKKIDRYNI